jgi:hypothetical protein
VHKGFSALHLGLVVVCACAWTRAVFPDSSPFVCACTLDTQSRAKTSASTGDIPLYVASPSERIVDNGRINGGFAMQKRHLDMEMQHYHRLQLDREWERERDNQREREREWEWELERQRERESERLRRNSYDTPSLSSATWSRAVGGDAQSGVHRQQQQGAHHGGAGGAQYYSSGSIGGGSDEGTLAARRLAEKAVNKSTPSLPVSSPLAMAAAPKSAPLPQDRHQATAMVPTPASQPAPGLLPLQQQQQQHSGSTVKLTPPIYNTPSSQHQKKTVWKQRSPSAPHQAPGGTAPNAGSAQPQANTQDLGAVSSGGAAQLQMHSGQLPSPHMVRIAVHSITYVCRKRERALTLSRRIHRGRLSAAGWRPQPAAIRICTSRQ